MKQETAPSESSLIKRMIICAIGMFLYATGVAFTKNPNLGISPIVSVAFALNLIYPVITLGWYTTILNLIFFAIQRILLGREYPLRRIVIQFIMSVLFSITIDATAVLWSFVQPQSYPARLLCFIFGCLILASGVVAIAQSNFEQLPAEGVVTAVARKTSWKFGNVKIGFDACMVLTTCILSFLFLGSIKGIREGTLIAVLLIGTFAKMLSPRIARLSARFIRS